MKDAEAIFEELLARVRLANRSGTLLLLVGEDQAGLEETRGLLVSLLAAAGMVVEGIGKTGPRPGPVEWVNETKARPADAFVAIARPGRGAVAQAFGRRLNGERENLRALAGPLLLFMTAEDERALRSVAPDFFTWVAQGFELPPAGRLRALATSRGAASDRVAPGGVATGPEVPPIRFLHLSDIHLKTGVSSRYDQSKVLKGLLKRLELDRKESPLDLVFFTGDLANAGKADEYKVAATLLGELLEAAGVDKSRLFVVPGNHDVDRAAGRWVLRTLDNAEEATEFFVDPANRAAHERKFAAYRDAMAALLGEDRPLGLRVGAEAVELREVRGVKLAVASFNSAWFSVANNDHEKLWLGEANVERAAERIALEDGVTAAIALMHHPLDYLAEHERDAIDMHFERSFDLVLRGHLHRDKARSVHTGRGEYVELAAPAAYQGSRWPNGCFTGEIRLAPLAVRLRPYKFGAGADPWTLDPSVFPDDEADGYCHTFALPKHRTPISRALEARATREILGGIEERAKVAPNELGSTVKSAVKGRTADAFPAQSTGVRITDAQRRKMAERSPSAILSRRKLADTLGKTIPKAARGPSLDLAGIVVETLGQFVDYWRGHRGDWLDALDPGEQTHVLAVCTFFQRQLDPPLRIDVGADLVIEAEGRANPSVALLEVTVGSKQSATRMERIFERSMDENEVDVGALFWFKPDRSPAEFLVRRETLPTGRTVYRVEV